MTSRNQPGPSVSLLVLTIAAPNDDRDVTKLPLIQPIILLPWYVSVCPSDCHHIETNKRRLQAGRGRSLAGLSNRLTDTARIAPRRLHHLVMSTTKHLLETGRYLRGQRLVHSALLQRSKGDRRISRIDPDHSLSPMAQTDHTHRRRPQEMTAPRIRLTVGSLKVI